MFHVSFFAYHLSLLLLPGRMLLTPDSCLRGAEGELMPWVGNPPSRITPPAWQSSSAGIIEFATLQDGCRYHLSISQTQINAGTETLAVGILDVTAVNLTPTDLTSTVWISWRQASLQWPSLGGWRGFLVNPNPAFHPSSLSSENPWNPAWTWYFRDQAFVRNQEIVYWVPLFLGWDMETTVRLSELPYRDVMPETPVGFSRFTSKLRPNARLTLRVWVPYKPIPLERRGLLETLLSKS